MIVLRDSTFLEILDEGYVQSVGKSHSMLGFICVTSKVGGIG